MPPHEKPLARDMIRERIPSIRKEAKIGSDTVVITPRVNGLETGLFHDDVTGSLSEETAPLIDG